MDNGKNSGLPPQSWEELYTEMRRIKEENPDDYPIRFADLLSEFIFDKPEAKNGTATPTAADAGFTGPQAAAN